MIPRLATRPATPSAYAVFCAEDVLERLPVPWVKLSGASILSADGPPLDADRGRLARAFVEIGPERLVWGSDWPHPTAPVEAKPDDAILLDRLADRAADAKTRTRILVDNPAELYGFLPATYPTDEKETDEKETDAIVERLNETINVMLKKPAVVSRLREIGITVVGGTPETLARQQAAAFERCGRVIEAADIKVE